MKSIVYVGPSMHPTLKSLDRLQIIPYDGQGIRRGDVVAILPPGGGRRISHRVISVDSQGVRTRGDNNRSADSWVLSHDNILGRVVYAQRGNRRLRVHGGPMGRLCAGAVRAIRGIGVIRYTLSTLLHPAYHRLAQRGVFRKWLADRVQTQILSFSRPAGTELQLIIGQRVIGQRPPGKDQWHIRRPFRLFVDESSLP